MRKETLSSSQIARQTFIALSKLYKYAQSKIGHQATNYQPQQNAQHRSKAAPTPQSTQMC